MRLSILKLTAALSAGLVLAACGSAAPSAPPAARKGSAVDGASADAAAGALLASNCRSPTNCPQADVDLTAPFVKPGLLMGIRGEPVAWLFQGLDRKTLAEDQAVSVRRVAVVIDELPQGARVKSPRRGAGSFAQVVWQPDSAGKGTLALFLRDLDRCLAHEDEDDCLATDPMPMYDTRPPPIRWEIVEKAAPEPTAAGPKNRPKKTKSNDAVDDADADDAVADVDPLQPVVVAPDDDDCKDYDRDKRKKDNGLFGRKRKDCD